MLITHVFSGKSGKLSVRIQDYDNHRIRCEPYTPQRSLARVCSQLPDAMPVSYNLQRYGPPGLSGVDVVLPWSLEKADTGK